MYYWGEGSTDISPLSGMMSVGVGSNASGAKGDSIEPKSTLPWADVQCSVQPLPSQVMSQQYPERFNLVLHELGPHTHGCIWTHLWHTPHLYSCTHPTAHIYTHTSSAHLLHLSSPVMHGGCRLGLCSPSFFLLFYLFHYFIIIILSVWHVNSSIQKRILEWKNQL